MADVTVEQKEEADRLARPADVEEGKILEENPVRKQALEEIKDEPKKEALPKLSAAEFRVYNSMAEHMEYFVSTTIQMTEKCRELSFKAQPLPQFLDSALQCVRIW